MGRKALPGVGVIGLKCQRMGNNKRKSCWRGARHNAAESGLPNWTRALGDLL